MNEHAAHAPKHAGSCCHAHGAKPAVTGQDGQTARDPVCGMSVQVEGARHTFEHQGQTHHFCSARCRQRFMENPATWLEPAKAPAEPVDKGAMYTCPMHPEVRQRGPGSCPKCGMALEPELPGTDDGSELNAVRRRFLVAAALALPLLLLAMVPHLSGHAWPAPFAGFARWAELALATPLVVWIGADFLRRGWQGVLAGSQNMYSLIGLGVGVAFAYSLVALFAPGLFPPSLRDAHGDVPLYFESAGVIIALVQLGEWLELRARGKTSAAIRRLLDLSPKLALRIDAAGAVVEVPVADIAVGDRLQIRPGATLPVDGTVLEGASSVDESMLSGEAMPVAKAAGDAVTAGTLNGNGSLVMRAARVGADTVLARIIQLVAQAQRSRAPMQRLADRVAAWFVPAVVAIAVLAFATWLLVGPPPRLAHAIVSAVAVLIIACPCALGLATPISIMVASGRGAEIGVLYRDAAAIETLGRIDTLVLDKTGTLTAGRPELTALVATEGEDETEVLRLAAALESASEHPLATAVREAAKARGIRVPQVTAFQAVTGQGVVGEVEGQAVRLGNATLMQSRPLAQLSARASALAESGATVMYVARADVVIGLIAATDPLKPDAAESLRQLKATGLRLVMLTGDNAQTAAAIARDLPLDEVHAGQSPLDKAARIEALRKAGRVVAMAGDGINDAPALAAANVGIAMGQGSDVAIESAQVTLVKGELAGLLRARRLALATLANIRQNLTFAFGYNAIGVPIAAGVLYPAFGFSLSPMLAALAMSLSSISVIGSALRLRKVRI